MSRTQDHNITCKHCKCAVRPDARNLHMQKYCSSPECRKASKAESNLVWREKPENVDDYFRGPEQVAIEEAFRQSKDHNLVGVMPVRHWTDSKIRCHLFCCVAALAFLRLIDLQLKRAEVDMTAASAMRELHRLHSCLV